MNHTWLILMCMGCLCAGLLAGQFVEVDETKLKPKFRKEDVMESAMKQFEFRPDLAATSIRVAFVLAARRAGFAAGTVDESCAVVDGLGDIAGVFHYLGNTYHASMEDLTSLAAIAAIRYLNGPYEAIAASWRWGRNDSDVAPPRKVPTDPQKKTFSVPTILHGLGDLTDEECVALMACHSVGEFHETVTGLDEAVTHTGKRYTLSNAYYQFLLEQEKRFKPLEVQRTEDNKDLKELPKTLMCTYANVVSSSTPGSAAGGGEAKKKSKKRQCVVNQGELDALLHNRTWRAIVVRFAKDEDAWREAFTSGFVKMIEGNFKRLRVYSDPDSKDGATSATAAQPTSTVSTPTQ